MFTQKLYMIIFSRFICNSRKPKAAQMVMDREVQQPIIHIHQGILLSNKEEQTIDTSRTWMKVQRIKLSPK